MKKLAIPLVTLSLIAYAASVPAQAANNASELLPPESVNALELIPAPPPVGSPQFLEEMFVVEWLQETRTPEQVTFVEMTLNTERFAPVIGDVIFEIDGPALKTLVDQAIDEVRSDYDAVKAVYDYPRPFEVNAELNPVGDARPVASYPSGHSIRAVVYARLLAEIVPEKSGELMDLANRIGHGRVIAGVHYPMDVTSGQTLGNAYADAIISAPGFSEKISGIRKNEAS